ncbi:MAG: gamma-glutamylcyclotransferase [Acidobacteria bacterium]|nr:gamma-glutamylcyclotransferase [Acidobacteriota bacterium]
MPLVFQYGSNCNERRVNDKSRLNGDARDLGRALTVEEFEIAFNKRRQEKGDAAADLIKPRKGKRRIWGVLYEISKSGFEKLKNIEGPSYKPKPIVVNDAEGRRMTAKTFRVRRDKRRKGLWTGAEYVGHIVNGLRAHGIPEEYVQHVIGVAIDTNHTSGEHADEQTRLIESLRELPSTPSGSAR